MMPTRCPHCGARNPGESANASCVSCGRPMGGGRPDRSRSAFDDLQSVGGLPDMGLLGGSSSPFGRTEPDTLEDGGDGGLGAMPTGDEAAQLDLKRLLGQSAVDDGAPFFGQGGGGGGGFRFDASPIEATDRGLGSLDGGFAAFDDDDEATRGNLMVQIPPEALRDSLSLNLAGPPRGGMLDDEPEEESTRVVDQGYVEEVMQNAPLELGLGAPAPVGWRVRNERGVVYELMTVDAVVAWLEGKPDISGVRVARGDGVFMEVDAFPELAGRLGVRKPVDDRLTLDISRASERHGPGSTVSGRRSTVRPDAPTPRETGPASVGLGMALGAVAGGFLLVAAVVVLSVGMGWMSLPPPIESAPAATSSAPEGALKKAIEAYEAGHYDAAINRLQGLTRSGTDDPRVQRYLALALHKNNRGAEARRALAEYRRQMRAVDREK